MSTEKSIPFSEVAKLNHSGVNEEIIVSIANQSEWASFWKSINASSWPVPEAPAIDFATHQIIGVFMGLRSSGGYKVEVAKITKESDRIIVHVERSSPGGGMGAATVMTTPGQIVAIQKQNLPVVFETYSE